MDFYESEPGFFKTLKNAKNLIVFYLSPLPLYTPRLELTPHFHPPKTVVGGGGGRWRFRCGGGR